jgi:hypothetical protein
MNKRTYVGLDVHARSVKGCAIDHETGEILRQSLAANDAGVAEWVSGLPGPVHVVYEVGTTGSGSPGYCWMQGLSVWSRHPRSFSGRPGTG